MGNWAAGQVLSFDLETTGLDRFHDVPVSFALVTLVAGQQVSLSSGLVDPGREIPGEATGVHGITTERARNEGASLEEAIAFMVNAVVSASNGGVPLVGMKLDYDLTILDTQSRQFCGAGLVEKGWGGPVLDVVVLDRHHDRYRKGSRTLSALCAHYGVEIAHAHDAVADAVASANVLFALSVCFQELDKADPYVLHQAQVGWYRDQTQGYQEWRLGRGLTRVDDRDFIWPVAPASLADS